jgi:hypothetical protein
MQFLFAGSYTWIASIFFGTVLLDIVYARLARYAFTPSETASLFSEAADFLLLILAFTILASVGAIIASWQVRSARNAFVASILCIVLPLMFYSLISAAQADLGPNLGMWVRLVTSGLSSILAFAGLWELYSSAT